MPFALGFWANTAIAGGYYASIFGTTNSGSEPSYASTIDTSGNVYATGYNGTSGYVIKFDTTGAIVWQTLYSVSTKVVELWGIKLDTSGNIYIAGLTQGAVGYYLKLSSTGSITWQKTATATAAQVFNGLYVDSSANGYIVGEDTNTTRDCAILKYDSTGAITWQRKIPNSNSARYWSLFAVATDSAGNVYAGGERSASVVSAGYFSVIKYNSSGTFQWALDSQGSLGSHNNCQSVVIDSGDNPIWAGNVYVSTVTYGTLVKTNNAGTIQWQRKYVEGTTTTIFTGVARDSSDNFYCVGYLQTGNKLKIVKYNSSGTIQWDRSVVITSATGVGSFPSISIDPTGTKMYIAGTLTETTGSQGFVISLPTDGSKTGTYTVGTYTLTYSVGTGTDSAGSMTLNAGGGTPATNTLTAGTGAATSSAGSFPVVTGAI